MKEKKSIFLLILAAVQLTFFTNICAMQMQVGRLDVGSMSNSQEDEKSDSITEKNIEHINRDSSFHYPGNVSLILGYSRTNVKNGQIDHLSVTPSTVAPNPPLNNFTTKTVGMNGITLGINQFLTYHFGYEILFNYYFKNSTEKSYTGVYDPSIPNVVNTTSNVNTKLMTTELMGLAGLHLTNNILLIGKLGLGYERFQQESNIQSTFTSETDTYSPYDNTVKKDKFGLATGADLRFDLNENFSLSVGVNDLIAKQNVLAYQAALLFRL